MTLLDTLAAELRCEYLSDLRQIPRESEKLRCAVAQLRPADFPAKDWIAAAEYICDMRTASAEEAQAALLQH